MRQMKLNNMLIKVLENANSNIHSMNFALNGSKKKDKNRQVKQLSKQLKNNGYRSRLNNSSSKVLNNSCSKASKKQINSIKSINQLSMNVS